jgi:hypothetical protein
MTVTWLFIALAMANDPMPVAEQNALVHKYCAPCHSDPRNNYGLSLEAFDAANLDPSVAAMLVGKLKGGAIGASGIPRPDRATQDALLKALAFEATGASNWSVRQTTSILTASSVQELPSPRVPGELDLYRLTVTCDSDKREARMLVAWAPGDIEDGATLSVSADGRAPAAYTLVKGQGHAILDASNQGLPIQSLTVRGLVYGETAIFPFSDLSQTVRQALAVCFAQKSLR